MNALHLTESVVTMRIADAPLPNRAKRCLLRAGIETVEQLTQRTADDLLTLRNFAETSLGHTEQFLHRHGLSLATRRSSGFESGWVTQALDDPTFGMPLREQRILRLRHGLDGGAPLTLERVGEMLGLTRERVRQLQKAAEQRVICHMLFGRASQASDGEGAEPRYAASASGAA